MEYQKIIMDGNNRWLGLRICLDVSEVLEWNPSFSVVQGIYTVHKAALGRGLHSGDCSEAMGRIPARYRIHPYAQCFLLHVSHRNTEYWASLNAPHQVPKGERHPHKPVNGRQERGGIRHAWQIFITFFKASLDEVHMDCASMSSMEHIQNRRIHLSCLRSDFH